MPTPVTERKTNLITLFNDLLVLGTSLRVAADCGEPRTLRSQLLDLFYQVNQAGNELSLPKETMKAAGYAVAAYLDEMIMISNWPQKHQWPELSLQSELFGIDTAGQGFFDQLDEIWSARPLNADLLELYYLCLALGFEGKYKLQGKDQLKAVVQEMGRDIQAKRGEAPPLSLGETVTGIPAPARHAITTPWIAVAAGTLFALGLFLILMLNISRHADAVAVQLKELGEKVVTLSR